MQLVEVKLAGIVDALARNREQQPGGADARAFAVGAGVLHHHLVEPRFHAGVRFAALPIAAVMPLNAARDSSETELLAGLLFALDLRVGRQSERELLMLQAIQNRVPHRFGKLLPGRFEGKTQLLRQAVHHMPVPGVGVVLEGFFHEATAQDAAARVGDQQLGVRQFVNPETAAGAAGTLGVVEHEVFGLDVAVDEMMRFAAQGAIEASSASVLPAPLTIWT